MFFSIKNLTSVSDSYKIEYDNIIFFNLRTVDSRTVNSMDL
jgi:hypothetical protein